MAGRERTMRSMAVLRAIHGDTPFVYPIMSSLFLGRRSNSAQTGTPTVTLLRTMGGGRALCAEVSPSLSPGLCHTAPYRTLTSMLQTGMVGWCTQGSILGGIQGGGIPTMVVGKHTREVHTLVYTPYVHPAYTPPYVHLHIHYLMYTLGIHRPWYTLGIHRPWYTLGIHHLRYNPGYTPPGYTLPRDNPGYTPPGYTPPRVY